MDWLPLAVCQLKRLSHLYFHQNELWLFIDALFDLGVVGVLGKECPSSKGGIADAHHHHYQQQHAKYYQKY